MPIDVNRHDGAAVLALNRPPVNAFSAKQIEATIAAVSRLASDQGCCAALVASLARLAR